ncbi:sigma factor-like helix-turn-helix DNA-binding protein [Oscillospiraceae bacterium PP1C4]
MEEGGKYTIIVNKKRIEVSEDVYRAYHQEREAERYQNKLIRQHEMSLERFRDNGVNIDYLIAKFQPDVADKLISEELLKTLRYALDSLPEDEKFLINELFFIHKSKKKLAKELGIPRMTLNDKKHRILTKLKKILDI